MTMKQLLSLLLTLNLSITLFCCSSDKSQVNKDAIGMENLAGLEFTQTERDTFLSTLTVLKGRHNPNHHHSHICPLEGRIRA